MENLLPTAYAIIGKAWLNSKQTEMFDASYTLPEDKTFEANQSFILGTLSFRTDRNLNTSKEPGKVSPLELKAGAKLLFFKNPKRTERDPDFSVSTILPIELAKTVIENSKKAQLKWRAEHPITQ